MLNKLNMLYYFVLMHLKFINKLGKLTIKIFASEFKQPNIIIYCMKNR